LIKRALKLAMLGLAW